MEVSTLIVDFVKHSVVVNGEGVVTVTDGIELDAYCHQRGPGVALNAMIIDASTT